MVVRGLDREIYFGENKTAKCMFCKKKITPQTAVCTYARLLCRECAKKLHKQAKAEVERAFTEEFFNTGM